ncbi:MAG: hypothetical protein KAS94_10205 [Desulfobulbaceae bacterium]|nr:hypothetical protein [Desulfobulbaceae bacterium]
MVLKKSSLVGQKDFQITCPKCTKTYEITPAKIEQSDHLFKIFGMKGLYIYQCTCGTRINVQLDFRRKNRHDSEIGCFYTTLTEKNAAQQLGIADQLYGTSINSVIKDISADGIGFMTHGDHDIKPDDKLLVKFIIQRGKRVRMIKRRVIVRTVSGQHIGAEFFSEDKKDPEIGFYLMQT